MAFLTLYLAMHAVLVRHAALSSRVAPHAPVRSRSSTIYCMANGKKRRKSEQVGSGKPKQTGSGESAEASSSGSAGRVTSDSLLSVRKQIAYAKAYQAYKSKDARPVYRTSFRRQRTSGQDDGDEEEKLAPSEEDTTGWALPLLFVDGYNIIGKWARLKKRKEKGDMAGARQMLLDDLLQFAPRRFEVAAPTSAPAPALSMSMSPSPSPSPSLRREPCPMGRWSACSTPTARAS